ncbi:2TM domain-containing protein, partial [Robiginitalea sp.]|nr:2TM domain-containing protein [Robiginitalea sp.]
YGPDSDWFVWIVLLWSILLAYHWVQVFIMNRFLGPNWERIQRERLVKQQEFRIEAIKTEITDTENVASFDPPKTNS